MRCSQSFLDEIIKFLCSLESSFHVVLKNGLAFYDRTHMTKVMADKSLSTIFFRHPVYEAILSLKKFSYSFFDTIFLLEKLKKYYKHRMSSAEHRGSVRRNASRVKDLQNLFLRGGMKNHSIIFETQFQ